MTAAIQTYCIQLNGQVQGVGFRPFVFRLAEEMRLFGTVSNGADGVRVRINATENQAQEFYRRIVQEAPAHSIIREKQLEVTADETFSRFEITESVSGIPSGLLITPDLATCPQCRAELLDPGNRRHHYPFITCTHCGPRYSLIDGLPYDRAQTSMKQFVQCAECQKEYESVHDRRYYSQTNSCAVCGPQLLIYEESCWTPVSTESALQQLVQQLQQGGIVAIKGIGGFLLCCDAAQAAALERLRTRKHRPAKPLAVMYPNLEAAEQDVLLTDPHRHWLSAPEAPIVLAPLRETAGERLALEAIAPGLQELGIMLPYTPLFILLMEAFGKPVIATSGNVSGCPVIYTEEAAARELVSVADVLIGNNRPVRVPQDDSVLRLIPPTNTLIWLRRARGTAPGLPALTAPAGPVVLATGALLKSTVAIQHPPLYTLSQYLGNTLVYEAQQSYEKVAGQLLRITQAQPELLLADLHPGYFSHSWAKSTSSVLGVPLQLIQHHRAHAAAVLGEHGLLDSTEPVLCICWDGTGLGDDGVIWGSECFVYQNRTFTRIAHLPEVPVISGDRMALDPRLSALAFLSGASLETSSLKPAFNDLNWNFYQKALQQPLVFTTSMGRLFDAVSCLLGLSCGQAYEGHAALLLESSARAWRKQHPDTKVPSLTAGTSFESVFPLQELLSKLLDRKATSEAGELAWVFHMTIANWVLQLSEHLQISRVACSGGVFQNALLVELLQERIGSLYLHQLLSPNDENCAFGQLMYHQYQLKTN